jgi:hypothetical protein
VHSREKTLVFHQLGQFLALQLSCLTNFWLIKLSKIFLKTLDVPAFSLPRQNSSSQLPAKLPDELLRAPFICLHRSSVVPCLHHLYDGPYAVLRCGPRSFTTRVGLWDVIVSISCLKACTEVDPTHGGLRRCGRLPGKRPGGPSATKRVLFSDLLVSSPSSSQVPPSNGPGNRFSGRGPVFCMPWTGSANPVSTATVPAPSAVTAT